MRLLHKVALITGGAQGIGEATARLFAREGAKVIIGDVLEQEGQRVAQEITHQGGHCLFLPLDVTQVPQWERTVHTAEERFGQLNILVNNAGIAIRKPLEEMAPEEWNRILEVNVKGVFLGIKAVAPAMRRAGGGSIVNISSIAGIVGHLTAAAYSASKGAVRTLTKNSALQLARDNIRINSLHPGVTDTPLTSSSLLENAHKRAALEATIPMGRVAYPRDIAPAILFLASDESSYMTGSEMVVDGGQTAYFPLGDSSLLQG